MITFTDFRHPLNADFEAGRNDGSEFNPRPNPGSRTGDALAAYLAGYKFGEECMEEYLASQ